MSGKDRTGKVVKTNVGLLQGILHFFTEKCPDSCQSVSGLEAVQFIRSTRDTDDSGSRTTVKQTERILEAMRANPDGVCSTMMVNEYIMRPAARIGELKKQGHNIETVECPYFHHSHPANVATYKLVSRNTVLAGGTQKKQPPGVAFGEQEPEPVKWGRSSAVQNDP